MDEVDRSNKDPLSDAGTASEGRGLRVRGRVQGVGFRWWTDRSATRLGVAGTVRNCSDGSVEVMAVGSKATLDALEVAIRKGPPMARVEEVERVPCTVSTEIEGFTIVR